MDPEGPEKRYLLQICGKSLQTGKWQKGSDRHIHICTCSCLLYTSDIKDWTLDAYRRVLENEMIWRGFLNSFLYSFVFTVISVFVTLLAAFPLSKKEFVGRKFFNLIFLITMFFGGGMIPVSYTHLLTVQQECRSSLGLPFRCFADPLERPIYFPCLVLSI